MTDTYPIHGVIVALDASRREMFLERPCEGRMIVQPSHWNYDQLRDWMDSKCVVFAIGSPAVGLPLLMYAQVKPLEWDAEPGVLDVPPTAPAKKDDFYPGSMGHLLHRVMERKERFTLAYYPDEDMWRAGFDIANGYAATDHFFDQAIAKTLKGREGAS